MPQTLFLLAAADAAHYRCHGAVPHVVGAALDDFMINDCAGLDSVS